ncbi:unnamed protein product [Nyctereutes procyonoides]|uniref:(raccoon dog) hypothetical protein n=1 Tax=Nyctereutes procyonoides TaxID=34880 RepID=A0A811YKX7_NYCPR|nr:unnamed protein product [Nyctereutes procyonoides]
MYTPRKNVWVEVCPACDTRLQGHRYEATVAWGHADHDRRAQWLLLGQTGEECRVVSEPRRVSRLGPCCTQSFPGACGQGFGCVHVCTGHRLQEGGPFLQEWVREGVPGSEVTSVSQSPMELGTPVTRHPHPVQPQLRLTWLETSATGRCSLAAFPPLGALAPRNPGVAASSNAVGIGSSIDVNADRQELEREREPQLLSPLGPQRRACQGGIPGLPAAHLQAARPLCPTSGCRASAGKGHQIAPTKSSRTELLEHEARQLMLALLRRDGPSPACWKYGWSLPGTTFVSSQNFPSLMKLLRFLRQNMPGSDMELRAPALPQQFRRPPGSESRGWGSNRGGLLPHRGHGEFEAILAAESEGSAHAEATRWEAKPLQIVVTALESRRQPLLSRLWMYPSRPPNSMEQPASGPENPLEPPEEPPAPAPNVSQGKAQGLRPRCLAPEVKVVHELVEPMVPLPHMRRTTCTRATPEE